MSSKNGTNTAFEKISGSSKKGTNFEIVFKFKVIPVSIFFLLVDGTLGVFEYHIDDT